MSKRKHDNEFLKNSSDSQTKTTGQNSNDVINIIQDVRSSVNLGEMYDYSESSDPDHDPSCNLLKELSPLVRFNDRKKLNTEEKPKKPKISDEQIFNNRVIILTRNESPVKNNNESEKTTPGSKVGIKTDGSKINHSFNNSTDASRKGNNSNNNESKDNLKTPTKPVSRGQTINNIKKLPKVKINLDSNAPFNDSPGTYKTSPPVKLQLRAADPKLLNDSNFKEKVRRFRESRGEPTSHDNSIVEYKETVNRLVNSLNKNESLNVSRVNNLGKSGDKPVVIIRKEVVHNNNNNNYNSSSSSCSNNNNNSVNKKTIEISENLVSTTTESTQSSNKCSECSKMNIMVDIFWGMMKKMKERCKDIEAYSKKSSPEVFREFGKQHTVEDLMSRLKDKDKLINQLQDVNKDLTEKLRREKMAVGQLRINLMRCQKELMELKSEVASKTDLMNEIYEGSLKLRAYFEDEDIFDDTEDDLSQT